jgi:hypothetical protein
MKLNLACGLKRRHFAITPTVWHAKYKLWWMMLWQVTHYQKVSNLLGPRVRPKESQSRNQSPEEEGDCSHFAAFVDLLLFVHRYLLDMPQKISSRLFG